MRGLSVIALTLALAAGCVRRPDSRAGFDRHGAPEIRQTGDVKTPARASVVTTKNTLIIPAGSVVTGPGADFAGESQRDGSIAVAAGRVTPRPPASWSVTLSKPAELRAETRREAVEGAETPPPPSPPSPVEIARAKGVRWFYVAGVLSGVAAVVGFWRRYFLGGACCAAGALAFPLVGNLASEKWAVAAGGVCIVAAGAFVLAWKLIARRHGLAPTS